MGAPGAVLASATVSGRTDWRDIMTGFPWQPGDPLLANDLNAAIVNAGPPGGPFLPISGGTITAPDGETALLVNASNTQTAADHPYNAFWSTVNYTADSTGGDNLAFGSYMVVRPNGHQVMLSGHTSGLYGNAYLDNDGNAASHVAQLVGVMAISGNGGPGTLDRGIDYLGHANFNSGGGTYTDHYFLFQEPSHGATHEYGAYFSAPVGIGVDPPSYNLHMYSQVQRPICTRTTGCKSAPDRLAEATVTSTGAVVLSRL